MKPIQLFGAGTGHKSLVACAQRRLNCYWEIQSDGDKANAVIYGTPGTTLQAVLPNIIRGMRVSGSLMTVVNGSIVSQLNTALGQTLLSGSMTSMSGRVSMDVNATQMIIVDGIAGYIITLPSGAVTAIADADFRNGCRTCTYVGGYFIVERPSTAQFWVCDLNNGLSWSALFYQSAFSSAETLVAVDSDHGVLILFGTTYMEYWTPNGALDFPFGALRSAAQQYGLAAIWSRAHINNGIAFLGSNPQGENQVFFLDLISGYAPQKISNSDIENIIRSLSVKSNATALSYMVDGHPMYQLTFPTDNISLLYDFGTSIWSETQTGVALTGRHVGDIAQTFNAVSYVSDYSNANLYKVDPDSYTDNGTAIKRQLVSRHLGDGNQGSIDELFVDMQTGVGLQSGQGSIPQIMLDVSKDGGRTYGNQRFLPMGVVGQYENRVIARRVVNGRDKVVRLTMTDPVKFVITREGATVSGDYQ